MLHRRLNLHLHAGLKQLLLTLYTQPHVTTIGYSKVSRGLRFPLEVSGLCTRIKYSEGSGWGQWKSRYAIHASRQSNDKVFRYLKRVIVTPAVYKLLAWLKPSFKYLHWADVTDYTHLCRLAVSWVFVKQSDRLGH